MTYIQAPPGEGKDDKKDPYRGEKAERRYFLISYFVPESRAHHLGGTTPAYYGNVLVDVDPVEWLAEQVRSSRVTSERTRYPTFPAPPPKPPAVLISAWPLSSEQFEKLCGLVPGWGFP